MLGSARAGRQRIRSLPLSDGVDTVLTHQDQRCRRKRRGEEFLSGLKVEAGGSDSQLCM